MVLKSETVSRTGDKDLVSMGESSAPSFCADSSDAADDKDDVDDDGDVGGVGGVPRGITRGSSEGDGPPGTEPLFRSSGFSVRAIVAAAAGRGSGGSVAGATLAFRAARRCASPAPFATAPPASRTMSFPSTANGRATLAGDRGAATATASRALAFAPSCPLNNCAKILAMSGGTLMLVDVT
jgi:hypothetical protein